MRSRRYRDHHPQAVGRFAAALAVFPLLLAVATQALCLEQEVAADGTVHRVRVEPWQAGAKAGGTGLRHVVESPDGSFTSAWIPGTDDPWIDQQPALDLDPLTQDPLLVWSRGSETRFNVYVSRFRNGAWSPPTRLFPNSLADQRNPRLIAESNSVHVVWTSEAASYSTLIRLTLDRTSLVPVFGPELLPTESGQVVPPSGVSSAGTEPSVENAYFASEVTSLPGEGGGQIVVHGVRDAPDPVDYVATFDLPRGLRDLTRCNARWLIGRFVVSFDVNERFYYFILENGVWSALRSIPLGDGLSAADARSQLVESMKRADGLLPD